MVTSFVSVCGVFLNGVLAGAAVLNWYHPQVIF